MSDFILVDLYSQRKEIAEYVHDWKVSEILEWMKQYGTVAELDNPHGDKLYSFTSQGGEQTAFRFTDNGELVILHPR
jgi:hypothetical protein